MPDDARERAAGSHTDAQSAGIGATAPITAIGKQRGGIGRREEGGVGVAVVNGTPRPKARWRRQILDRGEIDPGREARYGWRSAIQPR